MQMTNYCDHLFTDNTDGYIQILKLNDENNKGERTIKIYNTKNGDIREIVEEFHENEDVLEKYDYIICDLSPSYNLTAKNILYLADSIIVPIMDKNISSLRGAALFKELWSRDKYYLEKEDNDILATVLVGYEKQRTQVSDLFDQYLQKFEDLKSIMLDSFIRRSTFVEKSLLSKLSVGDYLSKNNQSHFSKDEIENMVIELKEKDVL